MTNYSEIPENKLKSTMKWHHSTLLSGQWILMWISKFMTFFSFCRSKAKRSSIMEKCARNNITCRDFYFATSDRNGAKVDWNYISCFARRHLAFLRKKQLMKRKRVLNNNCFSFLSASHIEKARNRRSFWGNNISSYISLQKFTPWIQSLFWVFAP